MTYHLDNIALVIRRLGRVSNVEMTTPMALICQALFPFISTFETPPQRKSPVMIRHALTVSTTRNRALPLCICA